MKHSKHDIALLVASPALGSILHAVLASDPGIRVHSFSTSEALRDHMRVRPVDLVVLDLDSGQDPADAVALALRGDPALEPGSVCLIALGRHITSATRALALATGVDEVIVKPMSPRYLLERVRSRLGRTPAATPARIERGHQAGSNVVQLFPNGRPVATGSNVFS